MFDLVTFVTMLVVVVANQCGDNRPPLGNIEGDVPQCVGGGPSWRDHTMQTLQE